MQHDVEFDYVPTKKYEFCSRRNDLAVKLLTLKPKCVEDLTLDLTDNDKIKKWTKITNGKTVQHNKY